MFMMRWYWRLRKLDDVLDLGLVIGIEQGV
jgi:hypothetical protein